VGASKFGQENAINLFAIHAVSLLSVCGIYDNGNIISENCDMYMKFDLYSLSDLCMPTVIYANTVLSLAPD